MVSALEEIMKYYNMIIYTASDQSYADSVIGYIDPMKTYFKFRLYRHNCVKIQSETGPLYVKDLRIIKNVSLNNMIIIDNSVLSFAFHLNNGIPILPFYSNKEDGEMHFLKSYLIKLAKYDNLALQNGSTFNLYSVLQETLKENEKKFEGEDDEEIKVSNQKYSINMFLQNTKKEDNKKNVNDKNNKIKLENNKRSIEEKKTTPLRKKKSILEASLYETILNSHNISN